LPVDEKLTPKWGHVTHFQILGPLYIFRMVKDRNFIFGAHTEYNMYLPTHNKLTLTVGVVMVI